MHIYIIKRQNRARFYYEFYEMKLVMLRTLRISEPNRTEPGVLFGWKTKLIIGNIQT